MICQTPRHVPMFTENIGFVGPGYGRIVVPSQQCMISFYDKKGSCVQLRMGHGGCVNNGLVVSNITVACSMGTPR
jgi:hypothetical protein